MRKANKTPRENTLGAKILFAEARARLEEILRLVDEFNEISSSLADMGYGPLPDEVPSGWPMPQIEVCANRCMTLEDGSILDDFWEAGPMGAAVDLCRRVPMVAKTRILGSQSQWMCFYCRQSGDVDFGPDGRKWHVDHMYPVSRGGDNNLDGLVLSCATCNLHKNRESAIEYFSRLSAPNEPPPSRGKRMASVRTEVA